MVDCPSLPAPPGALIFDMDGLMIDSEPLWWRVERALCAEHAIAWSDALAQACVGTGLPHTIATMRRAGLPLSIDAGVAWLIEAFIASIAELQLKPGCRELLDAGRAAAVPMAVASSCPPRLIAAVLARFTIAARFEATVSGEEVARPKPAPDIFLRAAALLGVDRQRAAVLEDSLAGVRAARAAGIAVIAVPERESASFALLTPHVVGDLHQARALLRM